MTEIAASRDVTGDGTTGSTSRRLLYSFGACVAEYNLVSLVISAGRLTRCLCTYTVHPPNECPTPTIVRPEKPDASLSVDTDSGRRGRCTGSSALSVISDGR